jgi:hypothetical protein
MTNTKRLRVTLLLGTLALVTLGALWLALNYLVPKPPSLINITRKEYEEAYNRWQQKGVIEYKVTTREVTRSSDCRAYTEVQQGRIVVVNGEEGCQGQNQYASIEQSFAAIDKRLQAEQNSGEQDKLTRWSVEFDPESGYPLRLAIEPAPGAPATIITSTTTVEYVDIIQAKTPNVTVTPEK